MSLNNGKDLGDANGITTYREERFSSRLSQSGDSAPSLKTVFLANWDQPFIFDALNGRERAVTYGEFLHLSIQLGKMLETFRVDRGNTICVMMNNSVELAETYLASLISGIVVVPLDPLKGENEVKEILSYAGHKLTLCNFTGGLSDIADKKPIIKIKSFSDYADSDILSDKKDLGILDNIDAGKPFLNTFTSGSTGVPKGVIHSFRNVYLTSIAFAKRFNFNSGSVFYHNLPMTYMAGILNLFFMPMICGSKVVVGERFGIAAMPRFWDFPIKYSANTFWFIPAMLALLMKLDRGSSGVEYAKRTVITGLVGTAPLNQKLRRDFEKRYGIPLYESYGLSETLFVSTNSPKGVAGGSGDGVGKPLDMVELNFQEDKEISIGVPWMFLGYSNVDAKQSFSGEKFLSGDLGEFESSSGFLKITGRKKDLIIRGGINISPRRTEEFVAHSDLFEESAIIGAEDANLGEKTICFFVPRKGVYSEDARKQLNRDIIEKLGKDYQVDEFVELQEIPKNINGKVDKPKLRKIYKSGRGAE